MPRDYRTYAQALAGRRLPAALVDLELFDANAAALVRRAGGKPLRLATKSVRCTALLRRVLRAEAGFRGLMAYHPREAAFLAAQGFEDLLVAYPTLDAGALAEVARAVAGGASVTLTVDAPEHVEAAARAARAAGTALPLCIDVDLSLRLPGLHFGVHRSPLTTPRAALALAERVRATPGVRLEGLLGYEAQIAGVPDRSPGAPLQSAALRLLKRRSLPRLAARRAAVLRALEEAGFALRFVNAGGTGSLESSAAEAGVTELAAGSGLFAPTLFDGYARFRHQPAALFALPITRRPAPDLYTCHGGGYVASGAGGASRLPTPFLPEGCELVAHEGAGEVQTPVRYTGPEPLALGAPLFFRHAKAGELCEHFATLLLVSGGRVVDEVPTYRGEGQCFLG
ncbi:amino acid deaminase/aldolase [Aggregicoccus sp. 17bor-14]|uniref:amino acid deaminase/aldolase n=1 Tax=Myxococcaceae TaxID=31 RepID=UPI00129D1A00|nr:MULTISPECIES: amino acid deaminase/aldolase [Myxococcaceae]MBF5045827.1 amino acid deaminase/aldolase [Simulacricoccus sp. 17bor-14]MRI91562.1 amino acid deaminase/aldolase [Aggregicoccus sp. 17bor-14]